MISQFSGAVFDQHRAYRFVLWRFWNDAPRVLFIGLNPSTADEYDDDPTLRRCLQFAEEWGYGGLYLCNLFSYRATYPLTLDRAESLHAANIPAITMTIKLVVLTVVAWGDGLEICDQGKVVAGHIADLVAPAMCFGYTKKGNPKHPLYLPADAELIEFQLN